MGGETVTISRQEYEQLAARALQFTQLTSQNEQLASQVAQLSEKVNYLLEQIRLAQKQRFGASSEKSCYDNACEQLSFLFNEAEAWAGEKAPEPDLTPVKPYTRKEHSTLQSKLPENIDVDVVEKRLTEAERACPQCGTTMEEIGVDIQRRLVIVPATFKVIETRLYRYACRNCEKNDTATPIRSAKAQAPVIRHSIATPEAVAYIMVQKYLMYSPLYRLEHEFKRAGIELSRQTMSNWLLYCAESWLEPVYNLLHQRLLKHDILQADETELQVLKEPGKKAQTNSYMWLYRTSGDAQHPIVLYEYQPTRASSHPKNFLKGYRGYLLTDGYQAYQGLPPEVIGVRCWAHCRRKFDEALKVIKGPVPASSLALRGKRYCDALFAIEDRLENLTPEQRAEKRRELAVPILNAFHDWIVVQHIAPKTKLGEAFTYAQNQWPWLMNYLLDGRLEISNNRAERSIKPFVMARKNFLFANVPKGAKASALIFSLIETAKENGLDPYRYLTWLMYMAPQMDLNVPEQVESLLPENTPDSCKTSSVQ